MKSKYEKLVALSVFVIRLEVIHGDLKWKVTDLARTSRTARSRIYELLGNNKSQIRESSLKLLLDELYSLSPEKKEFERENGQFRGFMRSREIVIKSPELLSFYFRNRGRADRIGEIIREKEQNFINRVAQSTGLKDSTHLLFVRTMIHGISLAPFLDDKAVSELMRKLEGFVKAGL